MAQLQSWILQLSDATGVDEWILTGLLFLMAGFVGKHAARGVLALMGGSHLRTSDLAGNLLRLLEIPTRWQRIGDTNILQGPGHSVINLGARRDPRSIKHGDEQLDGLLNRKERRLVYAKAGKILANIKATESRQIRDSLTNDLASLV